MKRTRGEDAPLAPIYQPESIQPPFAPPAKSSVPRGSPLSEAAQFGFAPPRLPTSVSASFGRLLIAPPPSAAPSPLATPRLQPMGRWLLSVKLLACRAGAAPAAPVLVCAVADAATGYVFALRATAWEALEAAVRCGGCDTGSVIAPPVGAPLVLSAAAAYCMAHAARGAQDMLRLGCAPTERAAPSDGLCLGDSEHLRALWVEVRRSLPARLGGSGAHAREAAAVGASDARWGCGGSSNGGEKAWADGGCGSSAGGGGGGEDSGDPFPPPRGAPVPAMQLLGCAEGAPTLALAPPALPAGGEPGEGAAADGLQRLLDGVVACFNVAARRPAGGGRCGAPRVALLSWIQAQEPAQQALLRSGSVGSAASMSRGGGGGGGAGAGGGDGSQGMAAE